MTELQQDPTLSTLSESPGDMPVGAKLKSAREAAQLAVVDIAQHLKLGARQVEALEEGRWDQLPGQTFIRGFVRNYARQLNLDPQPLMAQLDAVLKLPAHELNVPHGLPDTVPYHGSNTGRGDRRVIFMGLGAFILAALVYFLLPNDLQALREDAKSLLDSLARKETPPAAPVANTPEPVFPPGTTPQQVMTPQTLQPADAPASPAVVEEKAETPSVTTAEKAPESTSTVGLRVDVQRESWIEVRDAERKVIFSQRLLAGSQKLIEAKGPLTLHVGYAPGVKLTWQGHAVDLQAHTRGDVARLTLE